MNYNLNINNKNINNTNNEENNNESNDTFFDKLDKKIFGMKGKKLIKKFKKEILLIIIFLLFLLTILYCFVDDTQINNQKGGASLKGFFGGIGSAGKSAGKFIVGKPLSIDPRRGAASIRSFNKRRGIGALENKLSENKEYLKNMAYQIITFFIVVIVFMPSVSFIIIILITFNILKPKIKYLKSL